MRSLDPRTPVIVGVGQVKQRFRDYTDAQPSEQAVLMEQATLLAAADAGAPALLNQIDVMAVISGIWGYPDPGRVIADAVGSPDAATLLSAQGGNMPQATVAHAADLIAAGRADVVVVAGGEATYSKNKLRALGRKLPRTGADLAPAATYGADVTMSSAHEAALGFDRPTSVYPLFESAVRAAAGRAMDDHAAYISGLWARANAVSVGNPLAWNRLPLTPEQIRTPGPDNRMVASPYTKLLNSNSFVDYGGAVIVTSAERAASLGIDTDRWVFPAAATDGHATLLFSERGDFHTSPAIRHTGRRALELAGLGVDDIGPMDLYSCFPSVVQITMAELGIGDDRIFTTTGGLQFFGGPMNSYVVHAIASTVEAVRASAAPGFVHANGGFITKHSCAVYLPEPPSRPYVRENVQAAIDAHPTRTVDVAPDGDGIIESFTVLHGRDGAERALVTALMPDGRRALANTSDVATMAAMETTEHVGVAVRLRPDGSCEVLG